MKGILNKVLMFLLLNWSFNTLFAQSSDIPFFKKVSHPFMPAITSEYFFFSNDGILWFSTDRGLTSFDGSDVKYYTSLQQSNNFGLTRIFAMVEDKKHNFYIGTPDGLFYYNRLKKSFANLSYKFRDIKATVPFGVDALHCDREGTIYAGAANRGLFVYNPSNKVINHYNLDLSKPDSWESRRLNTVSSFADDAKDQNRIWIGSFHGIFYFDKRQRKVFQNFEMVNLKSHKLGLPSLMGDNKMIDVQKMDVASDSIIWFNSWAGGFSKYNIRTGKATIVFGRDALYKAPGIYYGYIIPKMVRFSDGKYLLGVYNGKTALYDTKTNRAIFFNVSQQNYSEEETRYIDKDSKGNIWILQRGVLYTSVPLNRRLQTVEVPTLAKLNFAKPKIRGIYFDSSSQLFYTGFLSSVGIHLYDTNFIQQNVIPTSLIDNYYNYGSTVDSKITKDGSGRFWLIGWKNHIMLPKQKKFELVEKVFPTLKWDSGENQFQDIVSANNGDVLIKSRMDTVYKINHITLGVDTFSVPNIKSGSTDAPTVFDWYDRNRDYIYLACKQGLVQCNIKTKRIRSISNTTLFGSFSASHSGGLSALDGKGHLWFVTPRYGIRIIDPVTLRCIDSIEYGSRGLIKSDFTSILGGLKNYMLFKCYNGILIYDHIKHQSFLFDQYNGLMSPENNSFLYSNGYLVIGQRNGQFEYFKLSGLDNYSSALVPYVSSLNVDTLNLFTRTGFETDSVIKLAYNQNTIALSFSVLEFLFPERVEYAYQLNPIEKKWHYTNYFNRKIIYSKLSPGKYTFRLKAQLQGGNWNTSSVEYSIVISPAWWQTLLFKILFVIGATFLVFYYYHRKIKLIQKEAYKEINHKKELLELEAKALRAQMNPHFIFNSLNSIKSLINKYENDKAADYLTIFAKLIRTLFQNSGNREISLFEELETCKLYALLEEMRFGNKIAINFEVDTTIDLKDIKVPALVLQPFIENSIWHGLVPKESGGNVSVSLKKENQNIVCMVEDDGIGRVLSQQYKSKLEKTHQSKGIGLTNMRLELDKRLNNREEEVKIVDKVDENGIPLGTLVILTFKVFDV
ncbi:MAG TPA: histidine kinase [Niabella sp.]|nr:histidine kinase [Niabella sp.]HOZ95749.1 histidine kinase [Niabella sp.]HQW13603.1 histidine kinase [Niabella sp.]HQX18997.1 histidine kinase [Niabella sp.]HRB06288.1 histidine kinase [Niabella sp.]